MQLTLVKFTYFHTTFVQLTYVKFDRCSAGKLGKWLNEKMPLFNFILVHKFLGNERYAVYFGRLTYHQHFL